MEDTSCSDGDADVCKHGDDRLCWLKAYVIDRHEGNREAISHRFTLDQAAEACRLFDVGCTRKVVLVWP
jgi:hypothetical protein